MPPPPLQSNDLSHFVPFPPLHSNGFPQYAPMRSPAPLQVSRCAEPTISRCAYLSRDGLGGGRQPHAGEALVLQGWQLGLHLQVPVLLRAAVPSESCSPRGTPAFCTCHPKCRVAGTWPACAGGTRRIHAGVCLTMYIRSRYLTSLPGGLCNTYMRSGYLTNMLRGLSACGTFFGIGVHWWPLGCLVPQSLAKSRCK